MGGGARDRRIMESGRNHQLLDLRCHSHTFRSQDSDDKPCHPGMVYTVGQMTEMSDSCYSGQPDTSVERMHQDRSGVRASAQTHCSP
jgi:hypothetical protein